MDTTNRVLLALEFPPTLLTHRPSTCPMCGGERPRHEPDCLLDLALAERGFHSMTDRDAARLRIRLASTPKLPFTDPLDDEDGER